MSQWLSPDTTFSSSPSMSKEGITPGRPPGFLAPWLLLAAEVDLQHGHQCLPDILCSFINSLNYLAYVQMIPRGRYSFSILQSPLRSLLGMCIKILNSIDEHKR
jgi:hypothetical protein